MTEQQSTNSAPERRTFSVPDTTPHPSSEYRAVFKSLLISTFVLIFVVSILLVVSYFFLHRYYVVDRMFLCASGLIYLTVTYMIWLRGRLVWASKLLIFFYFFISTIVLLAWGINTPFGLLIFAITIILSGILLGSKRTLYTAGLAVVLIFIIQTLTALGYAPLFPSSLKASDFGDAIAYSTLLGILALISWLFGRQTEHLLFKNRQAELALLKEKELLEVRVQERTRQLQKAQLEEVEQLYQFAEMGQLSAALLHDLANHLSVLNFDIADLKREQRTETLRHVDESIAYLEQAINQVRKQIQGKSEFKRFDVATCLEDTITILAQRAAKAHATISLNTLPTPALLYGDPLRLNHILGILIRNAIESYPPKTPKNKRTVSVNLEQEQNLVIIRVRDQGKGIAPRQREQLFAPLKSTKKDGLGIGLFIAKKITETHFKGILRLANATDFTEFVLQLPKKRP